MKDEFKEGALYLVPHPLNGQEIVIAKAYLDCGKFLSYFSCDGGGCSKYEEALFAYRVIMAKGDKP